MVAHQACRRHGQRAPSSSALRFAYGDGPNQFAGAYDRMLAFAARATSSFPFAFAPIPLDDIASDPSEDERRSSTTGFRSGQVQGFAFADGGYLLQQAVLTCDPGPRTPCADRPVTRKLLYVEPDPTLSRQTDAARTGRTP